MKIWISKRADRISKPIELVPLLSFPASRLRGAHGCRASQQNFFEVSWRELCDLWTVVWLELANCAVCCVLIYRKLRWIFWLDWQKILWIVGWYFISMLNFTELIFKSFSIKYNEILSEILSLSNSLKG